MTDSATSASEWPLAQPTSEILRSLAETSEPAVAVQTIVSAMGLRAHGIALVLLALPDAIPLPIPSLSSILGVPLVIIAGHLVIFGEGSGLPARVRRAQIPVKALKLLARFGAPVLSWLELITRPRWPLLLRKERLIGLVCLYLSLLLLLPIPLFNFPPALCLLAIAMGMVQRDGILVALGLVLTAGMTISLGYAVEWIVDLLGWKM